MIGITKRTAAGLLGLAVATAPAWAPAQAQAPARTTAPAPAEERLAGPRGSTVVVRMEGPSTADVPLQVVCYFKRTATSDARLAGAPVELDRHLGGRIAALRAGGEFGGDELETLLLDIPGGAIRARRLLLVGLGDEASLSPARLERVGRVALRAAAQLGATRVAFAPLIRDQGNDTIDAGAVEEAITRGVLLAYDTELRLQRAGFARPYALDEWAVEAGPAYFAATVDGVKAGIAAARRAAETRPPIPAAGGR